MSEVKSLAVRGQELKTFLTEKKLNIAPLLPPTVTVEKFLHVGLLNVNRNPALLQCTKESFYLALLNCAHLGILPDGVHGWAYLVPFRNKGVMEVTLIPGYKGFIHLAYEGGGLKDIVARAVFEDDEFDYALGTSQFIRHRPMGEDDPAKLLYAYAYANLTTGGMVFEVLTRKQIETTKARSRAGSSGPWVTDYVAMACKTAIRRLVRWLPFVTPKLAQAIELDERQDRGIAQGDVSVLDPDMELAIGGEDTNPPGTTETGEVR